MVVPRMTSPSMIGVLSSERMLHPSLRRSSHGSDSSMAPGGIRSSHKDAEQVSLAISMQKSSHWIEQQYQS